MEVSAPNFFLAHPLSGDDDPDWVSVSALAVVSVVALALALAFSVPCVSPMLKKAKIEMNNKPKTRLNAAIQCDALDQNDDFPPTFLLWMVSSSTC